MDVTQKITRVEVIDDEGRQFVRWSIPKVTLSFQDQGRTLKVFLKGREQLSMAWGADDEGVDL